MIYLDVFSCVSDTSIRSVSTTAPGFAAYDMKVPKNYRIVITFKPATTFTGLRFAMKGPDNVALVKFTTNPKSNSERIVTKVKWLLLLRFLYFLTVFSQLNRKNDTCSTC